MMTTTTSTATLTSPVEPRASSTLQDGDHQVSTQYTTTTNTTTTDGTTSTIACANRKTNISIAQRAPAALKVGTVKERIQMFGGNDKAPEKPEPTLIQKRRDQLSTKWEKDATKKIATHGACGRTGKKVIADQRKVEWYTCPYSGLYKKRISLRDLD